ncbi:glycosyltransferase [Pleurocapsa sp. CCALA 161]|uniref:TIGR04283 family arsenosugar biosynthesis glycosyltransferase n=1 Tax=Pleurocapsa sp. CCALA 161 TaxID=2107688 RepID=UPI000D05690F|nr:TIGR04283 family arsenosugar biosynthesis glycosyltransferase [Pleurocapsa sp. CCALA 161]PSB10698.1 glycosyltransferase [Pleurocapsa sp. CCALA 161]
MAQYIISIIIPVLDEGAIIGQTLAQLTQYSKIEIIVVDGGSQDKTVEIASFAAKVITVTGKGRAGQMNAGANLAQSDILLFLHSDTQLPPNFVELVIHTLNQNQVIAGAFELAIDGSDISLRWLEMLVKVRSHLLSLPYGDQALFIFKQTFQEAGGFADLPIMEDFEFIQRIKNRGKIAIAPAAVTTSARRWQKLGVWQTTAINQLMIAGYYLGISPAQLSKFYRYRRKRKS